MQSKYQRAACQKIRRKNVRKRRNWKEKNQLQKEGSIMWMKMLDHEGKQMKNRGNNVHLYHQPAILNSNMRMFFKEAGVKCQRTPVRPPMQS